MSIRTDLETYAGDLTEITDSELGKHLAQSVNNAYSVLPDSLLIESTLTPVKLYTGSATASMQNRTVIYVTRTNASSKRKLCLEVNPLHWSKYDDSDSIYKATKENPVYTVINESGIPTVSVLPAPTGASNATAEIAYVYWRPYINNLSDELDNAQIDNFPVSALKYVILNTSMFIMAQKLQLATLEEEDQELAGLIQQNLQLLNAQMDAELQRLKREESTPFDDQAIQQMEEPTKGKSTKR